MTFFKNSAKFFLNKNIDGGIMEYSQTINSMPLNKIPFEIDCFLSGLEFALDPESQKDFKSKMIIKFPNITEYIEMEINVLNAFKERWEEWKSENANKKKPMNIKYINKNQDKLNKCADLVNLMAEMFLEPKNN